MDWINKMLSRKFGIEIEFINADRTVLVNALRAEGISCAYEGYNHTTRNHWKIVTDATVAGGYELVSPPLQGEEGLLEVKRVLTIMHENKRNSDMELVNRSCGLHVHLDASDLDGTDVYWIVKRYRDNETSIDKWMPPSRRGDYRWCESLNSSWNVNLMNAMNTIEANARQQFSRTSKVNVKHAYARHGTIEFRHHAGSTDYNKIANWIEFLQGFVAQCIKIKSAFKFKHDYKPRAKSKSYASLREQFALAGGKLKYVGGSKWKIINHVGEEFFKTSEELSSIYDPSLANGRNFVMFKIEFDALVWELFGEQTNQDSDESLFAGVPHHVQEFFRMRTTQLERTA